MPINDQVTSYSVAVLRNDVVPYRRVIRLSLASGGTAQLLYPEQPPADWLTFTGSATVAQVPAEDFDDHRQLLQTEAPVFFTAINLFGLRALNLSSQPEPLGEGFADADVESVA